MEEILVKWLKILYKRNRSKSITVQCNACTYTHSVQYNVLFKIVKGSISTTTPPHPLRV